MQPRRCWRGGVDGRRTLSAAARLGAAGEVQDGRQDGVDRAPLCHQQRLVLVEVKCQALARLVNLRQWWQRALLGLAGRTLARGSMACAAACRHARTCTQNSAPCQLSGSMSATSVVSRCRTAASTGVICAGGAPSSRACIACPSRGHACLRWRAREGGRLGTRSAVPTHGMQLVASHPWDPVVGGVCHGAGVALQAGQQSWWEAHIVDVHVALGPPRQELHWRRRPTPTSTARAELALPCDLAVAAAAAAGSARPAGLPASTRKLAGARPVALQCDVRGLLGCLSSLLREAPICDNATGATAARTVSVGYSAMQPTPTVAEPEVPSPGCPSVAAIPGRRGPPEPGAGRVGGQQR